jgi:hypothetical protein
MLHEKEENASRALIELKKAYDRDLVHDLESAGGGDFEMAQPNVFLSYHHGSKAPSAARLLKILHLIWGGELIFLDSDNLFELSNLVKVVSESGVFKLLLTAGYLTRPYCLCEMVVAFLNNIR